MQEFLRDEFGIDLGNKIYNLQQKKLQTIIEKTTGKSDNQMKTLTKTILPRIALYEILQDELGDSKKAYDAVEKYMFNIVGRKMNEKYSAFEILPGFFFMLRKAMVSFINKSDNWVSEIVEDDITAVRYNITKCLWYDACVENNCPELCKIFCDTDHVIYDSMKKIKFVRKGTLGTGSNCCDFCFLNSKKIKK